MLADTDDEIILQAPECLRGTLIIRLIRGRKKRDPASGSLMTPRDRVLIELIKDSPLVRPSVGS